MAQAQLPSPWLINRTVPHSVPDEDDNEGYINNQLTFPAHTTTATTV